MVTDSSSGTLPSSSRLTMVSSSSIARSNGSRVTSEWGSSAMVIPVCPRCSRTLYIWARVGVGKAAHPQLFRVGKTVHATQSSLLRLRKLVCEPHAEAPRQTVLPTLRHRDFLDHPCIRVVTWAATELARA